jgi:two-component system cell cycle sensor histidine kinase/response regulator CckA
MSDIFATAFEAASSALLLIEKDSGQVTQANRAFLELCGRSRRQVVGQIFWQPPMIADQQAAAEARAQLLARGELGNMELPLEAGGGSLLIVEVGGREIGGGQVQLELRDVSARKSARIADRMAAQSVLASRAAAEFAELQKALQSAAGTLTECARRGESTFEQCDLVQKAAERADLMARELRACSGDVPRQPERVLLNELIEAMHLTLQRRMGPDIEVFLDLGQDVAPAIADLSQVRQIILKLAANSREAMEGGGAFRIETRNAQAGDPALGPVAGAYVVLAVSDNGPGLDDKSWEHLYEPFFTTKGNGKRGLGLAAVHGMVRQNGGRIWAESLPGQGTAFRIYLPHVSAEPAALEPMAQSAGRADRTRARTILLMEPNDALRGVMANILKKRGYRVLPAREAQEALEIAHSQGAPDLLISEPEADLAGRLAALRPGLRTLFLNGHSRGPAAGVATLAKPFELDALLGKVRELLAGVQ